LLSLFSIFYVVTVAQTPPLCCQPDLLRSPVDLLLGLSQQGNTSVTTMLQQGKSDVTEMQHPCNNMSTKLFQKRNNSVINM
jgi:hypothetical protein